MDNLFEFFKKNIIETEAQVSSNLEKECEKMQNILVEKEDDVKEIYRKYENYTMRKEFASGGLSFHRGYYLPSPIQDIYIDNANRGKLLNRLTVRSKISYEYCYNANDEMFFVVEEPQEEHKSYEWICYENGYEIGLSFDDVWGVTGISVCDFKDGFLTSYKFAELSSDKKVEHLLKEEYVYDEKGIKNGYVYEFTPEPIFSEHSILEARKYTFEHDAEGYLSKYTVGDCRHPHDRFPITIDIKRKMLL